MTKPYLEKSIIINAPAETVWQVFTDPELTRQMGGEYVTDWEVGSEFGWQGGDGEMYSHGRILKLEPAKLFQHNLFDPDDEADVFAILTYEFTEEHGKTILRAREEFLEPVDDQEYTDAEEGWDMALQAIKDLAEQA